MKTFCLFILYAAFGLHASSLAAAVAPNLSKANISPLYNKIWEPYSNLRTDLKISANNITISGRCPTPYIILDAFRTNDAGYIIEIRENKSSVRNAQMLGMPGCFSDGAPFVILQTLLPSSSGDGLRMWHCTSLDLLKTIVTYLKEGNSQDLKNFKESANSCHSEIWHSTNPK